jgi:hypothetical protein
MADEKRLTVLADLTPNPSSPNQGTPRGQALLAESIETCGVGRTIVVDKRGRVIAGNKLLAAAQAAGIPITVVPTSGSDLVVVQRTDLDLTEDPKARQLAYYDNRVSELDLSWSAEQVNTDLLSGVDVRAAFLPVELDVFTAQVQAANRALERKASQPAPAPAPVLDRDVLADAAEAIDSPTAESEPAEDPAISDAQKRLRVTDTIVFDNYEQQQAYVHFMRRLFVRTKGLSTAGARLVAYMRSVESA